MAKKFQIGSNVVCKIKGNSIVLARNDLYDTQLEFEIIGYDTSNSKYILLVPNYYSIKNAWNIIEEHLEKFDLDPNLLDHKAIGVFEDKILKCKGSISKDDGMFCTRCQEFYPMAEANQDDGTLKCYQCRQNAFR